MRRDYGSKVTDAAVSKALRKIRKVYAQAEKELLKKLQVFRKRFAARNQQMMEDLKSGKISKTDYETWLRGQVFIGERRP